MNPLTQRLIPCLTEFKIEQTWLSIIYPILPYHKNPNLNHQSCCGRVFGFKSGTNTMHKPILGLNDEEKKVWIGTNFLVLIFFLKIVKGFGRSVKGLW